MFESIQTVGRNMFLHFTYIMYSVTIKTSFSAYFLFLTVETEKSKHALEIGETRDFTGFDG